MIILSDLAFTRRFREADGLCGRGPYPGEPREGRPIADWQELIRASPLTKHMELVAWLKSGHGLGHGHANALVAHTLAKR